MINLVHIPKQIIDTSKYSNLLHDKIIYKFEEEFADYVGAKYACAVRSATDGIFLSLKAADHFECYDICTVPSLITTRFLNALISANFEYRFEDDVDWVGHDYKLLDTPNMKIYDSAQRVDKNQFSEHLNSDIIIFSFYPTKPIGGLQGGMVVSNNKEVIDWIRDASHFGEDFSTDSWNGKTKFVGWQIFMDSVNAEMAYNNFKAYPDKKEKFQEISYIYEDGFPDSAVITKQSDHLFRVMVKDNQQAMEILKEKGIITGVHYKTAHTDKVYGNNVSLPKSEYHAKHCLSLPYHTEITGREIIKVIDAVMPLIK